MSSFYASPAYLETAAEIYYKRRATSIEDVRVGDEVLRLLVVDGHRIVTNLPFLDYHVPLLASDIRSPSRTASYARAVVRGVINRAKWDPAIGHDAGLAPFVDWSRFATFAQYQDAVLAINNGLRRERERRRRRLADSLGEPAFTMDDRFADVLDFVRLHKGRQLRATGLVDYFADPRTTEFLDLLHRRGSIVYSTLRARGRLLSVWVGFVYDRVWSGWIFTYDPDLRRYSVGMQLLNELLETSFRLGHREFDFSIGAEHYKMVYATHARVLAVVGRLPLHLRLLDKAKVGLRQRSPTLFRTARALFRGQWRAGIDVTMEIR
jgi:CelD/BcsL family acetyltransferase involved in cellulose biosynthesis